MYIMKKKVLFGIFVISLLINLSFISSLGDNSTQAKINKAYDCLNTKIGDCSSLTLEDATFALLASGKCSSKVLEYQSTTGCWPKTGCTLKQTAQAILALSVISADTTSAENWLITQNASPSNVIWYLQVDSSNASHCTLTYDGEERSFNIDEDQTLSHLSTNMKYCFGLSRGDWWLQIKPVCYGKEFMISCEDEFKTNLLFKQKDSSIIHVSADTSSASSYGQTTEKVDSSCFIQGAKCNYEGSLWAALALNKKGHEIKSYLPYLTTNAESNSAYLPDSFLYTLTGQEDYYNNLLQRQRENKFWNERGNKFFDTALALYSVSTEPQEKINSKNWLLEVQEPQGCWGTTKDTGFILASIWPRASNTSLPFCTAPTGYCMPESSCTGNILDNYYCSGGKCCDTAPATCSEQNGIVCNSSEECSGISVEASGLASGETCCTQGTCEIPLAPVLSQCEQHNGTCEYSECYSDEEEIPYDCDDYSDVCCVEKKSSSAWIWILLFLIALVVLGIIFRNKLRPYWFKILSKFKKRRGGPAPLIPGRRFPPSRPTMPFRRNIPRKILPPQRRRTARRLPEKKLVPRKELGDVLKKLKEMSK